MTFMAIAIFYALGGLFHIYGLNKLALWILVGLALLEEYGRYLNEKKAGKK